MQEEWVTTEHGENALEGVWNSIVVHLQHLPPGGDFSSPIPLPFFLISFLGGGFERYHVTKTK